MMRLLSSLSRKRWSQARCQLTSLRYSSHRYARLSLIDSFKLIASAFLTVHLLCRKCTQNVCKITFVRIIHILRYISRIHGPSRALFTARLPYVPYDFDSNRSLYRGSQRCSEAKKLSNPSDHHFIFTLSALIVIQIDNYIMLSHMKNCINSA